MKVGSLVRKIKYFLTFENPPDFVMIHCGGNDIATSGPVGDLRFQMLEIFDSVQSLLPNSKIVYSQILPRLKWRSTIDNKSLDKARRRINNKIAHHIVSNGGYYIRYPMLRLQSKEIFSDDGVHLSPLGNDIFLFTIQEAFQYFFTTDIKTYPPVGGLGPWLCIQ